MLAFIRKGKDDKRSFNAFLNNFSVTKEQRYHMADFITLCGPWPLFMSSLIQETLLQDED